MARELVLLHGFSGTHRAWDGVVAQLDPQRYRSLALDLPGHGSEADASRPITFAGCVEHVLARSPERFTLCGYSMGGRVALHVALAEPSRVERLVLIGASPGIADERERAERRTADRLLADELEHIPFDEFIERWRTQPLFADDPPHVGELLAPISAATVPGRSLRCCAGSEPVRWNRGERLGELAMPVALVVGERDERFIERSRRMLARLSHASLTVLEGGHGLPLENPRGIAAVILGG